MPKLHTEYLGLKLKNPLIASASPLSKTISRIQSLAQSGVSAIVMYSLFEEQIDYDSNVLDDTLETGTDSFAESLSYLPDMEQFNIGPEAYLDLISEAKRTVDIPIIGSLNGSSLGGWVDYGRRIQEAGADALELNIYRLPTDVSVSGADIEKEMIEVVASVRKNVTIPLAVKIGPFYSSIPAVAKDLADIGADSIVIFNRFYQADIDLENLEVIHDINYSTPADLLLPLRWAAILYRQTPLDIAITGGVHSHLDILKCMMAGANVSMVASELLQNGVERVPEIIRGLELWMQENEYESIEQMRGSMSLKNVDDPSKYERAQYLRVLDSYRPSSPQLT